MTPDPYGAPDPRTVRRPAYGAPPPASAPPPNAAPPQWQPQSAPPPPPGAPPVAPPARSWPQPDSGPSAPGVTPSAGQLDPDRWGPQVGARPPAPAPIGGPPAHPGRRRRRRIVLAALATVVVAAAVVITVVATGGSPPAGRPDATVTTYLHDLAAGDAAGALAQGATPQSRTYLGAAVLRRQQELAPISDVRILGTSTNGAHAQVHATYRFGDRGADVTYPLTRSGGRWRLDRTTFAINVSALSTVPAATIFGKPLTGTTIDVFPGPVEWGSGNRYFEVTQRNADRFALSPVDPDASYAEIDAKVNAAGTAALRAATSKYVAACQASTSLVPPHCPQSETAEGAVKNSARWTLRTPLIPALKAKQTEDVLTTIEVTAELAWSCTYRATVARNKVAAQVDPDVDSSLDGTVDLTAAQPSFTPTS